MITHRDGGIAYWNVSTVLLSPGTAFAGTKSRYRSFHVPADVLREWAGDLCDDDGLTLSRPSLPVSTVVTAVRWDCDRDGVLLTRRAADRDCLSSVYDAVGRPSSHVPALNRTLSDFIATMPSYLIVVICVIELVSIAIYSHRWVFWTFICVTGNNSDLLCS